MTKNEQRFIKENKRMSERFVRLGIEIPLSIYSNMDKIKNGSAASNKILEAVKKEKKVVEYLNKKYKYRLKSYPSSVYGEMKEEK